MRDKVEAVLAREDEVALEVLLADSWDVLALSIDVLLSQTEVYHLDLVKVVLVTLEGFWVAHQDVVELYVVEGVAGIVDDLDLLQ